MYYVNSPSNDSRTLQGATATGRCLRSYEGGLRDHTTEMLISKFLAVFQHICVVKLLDFLFTRSVLCHSKMPKGVCSWSSAPDPAGVAYDASSFTHRRLGRGYPSFTTLDAFGISFQRTILQTINPCKP